jgi:class 3 adenylate cyclase
MPRCSRARSLALFLVAFVPLASAAAAPPAGHVPLAAAANRLESLVDDGGALTYDAVRRLPNAAWTGGARPPAAHASWLRPCVEWLRFTLGPRPVPPLLQTGPAVVSLAAYAAGSLAAGPALSGTAQPFADHALPYVLPTIALPPGLRSGSVVYVRIVTEYPYPAVRFVTAEAAAADQRDDFATRAFYVGAIFAFGLANLLAGVRLRDRALQLYAGLAFSAAAWFSTQGLLTSVYLWPYAAPPFAGAHRIVVDAYAIFLALFTRTFLDLRAGARAWDRTLLAMLGIDLAWGWIADLAPALPIATVDGTEVTLLALSLTVFAASIVRARDGYPGARFLVLASGGVVTGWTLGTLNALGLIPLVGRPIMMATAWESLLLALALADRIARANRERDREKDARMRVQADALAAEREANRLLQTYNDAFARFVPREFLDYLERESIVHVELGDHVERSMAVLFSDIRAFTTLSEKLGARTTFNYLNDYLQHVGPIVREHGGFIDKYIGDAVMALFPGGADAALGAAIALQRAVDAFNESPHPSGAPPIAVGVGLHAGALMLGTIGERRRLETTVIADAVNVASRVEGLTKVFAARILLTGAIRDALAAPDAFGLRPLGRVAAKGKSTQTELFECFDADEAELARAKREALEPFARALAAYERGEFARAAEAFGALARALPDDGAAAYYRDRALARREDVAAWDGVERMDVK